MKIDSLPLYWRLKPRAADKNIVPDFCSFEFDFNEPMQLITQKLSAELEGHLEEIYRGEYNIGYLQDDNIISIGYGTDFKSFMDKLIAFEEYRVDSILEVGCGGCTLLEQFKQEGYEVLGVDPSPIALKAGVDKNIEIVPEFFPSPKINKKYDAIFHSDVLEHVADPIKFLSDQREQLPENGLIFISVPDCNESIARGDVSMIIHQHLNYFDNESLKNCIEASGLKLVSIETANYGGSLYACAQNTKEPVFKSKVGVEKFDQFNALVQTHSLNFTNYIVEKLDAKESLGFYVPLRALPYISLLGLTKNVRFFDDTHHWYDCAFDGVDVYIENLADLQKKPVEALVICSLTFGDVIKNKILDSFINIKEIRTLDDFLN